MSGVSSEWIEVDGRIIQLRNRRKAALLAWLWPGAGHLYQGRTFKGWLLMVCILSTFMVGYFLGSGRVVYASWAQGDRRWQYAFQAAVGIPAFPAALQVWLMRQNLNAFGQTREDYKPPFQGFMAPPRRPVTEGSPDELAEWHREAGSGFELGSWYTVISGLLNILAIFDAYGGPLAIAISGKKPLDEKEEEADKSSASAKNEGASK